MVLALNRMDVARRRGVTINIERLAGELGVAVVPTVAVRRGGADALLKILEPARWSTANPPASPVWRAGTAEDAEQIQSEVRSLLQTVGYHPPSSNPWFARIDALLLHPLPGW